MYLSFWLPNYYFSKLGILVYEVENTKKWEYIKIIVKHLKMLIFMKLISVNLVMVKQTKKDNYRILMLNK